MNITEMCKYRCSHTVRPTHSVANMNSPAIRPFPGSLTVNSKPASVLVLHTHTSGPSAGSGLWFSSLSQDTAGRASGWRTSRHLDARPTQEQAEASELVLKSFLTPHLSCPHVGGKRDLRNQRTQPYKTLSQESATKRTQDSNEWLTLFPISGH